MCFQHTFSIILTFLSLCTTPRAVLASGNGIVPAIPAHLSKRLFETVLTDITCLDWPAAYSPMYFWDLFLEDVRSWECIDNGQRKDYFHGHDSFVITNNCGRRRCFKKKQLMSSVQALWLASTGDCKGEGSMGYEIGEPGVRFYLYGQPMTPKERQEKPQKLRISEVSQPSYWEPDVDQLQHQEQKVANQEPYVSQQQSQESQRQNWESDVSQQQYQQPDVTQQQQYWEPNVPIQEFEDPDVAQRQYWEPDAAEKLYRHAEKIYEETEQKYQQYPEVQQEYQQVDENNNQYQQPVTQYQQTEEQYQLYQPQEQQYQHPEQQYQHPEQQYQQPEQQYQQQYEQSDQKYWQADASQHHYQNPDNSQQQYWEPDI